MAKRKRLKNKPDGYAVVTDRGTINRVMFAPNERDGDDYSDRMKKRLRHAIKLRDRWYVQPMFRSRQLSIVEAYL